MLFFLPAGLLAGALDLLDIFFEAPDFELLLCVFVFNFVEFFYALLKPLLLNFHSIYLLHVHLFLKFEFVHSRL